MSNKEKPLNRRQVRIKEVNEGEPLMNASKSLCDIKTRVAENLWDKSGGCLFIGQAVSGVQVARLLSGRFCGTTGTILLHANRKAQGVGIPRLKIGMAADGADLSVRAMKAGNTAGAKGQSQYGGYYGQLRSEDEP